MELLLCSYNILADVYIKAEWYPRVDLALLGRERRRAAVLERVAGLGADLLCLQEVERDAFTDLQRRLGALGYEGHYARKGRGKAEGCAAFARGPAISVRSAEVVRYADGEKGKDTGCVAQLLDLQVGPAGPALLVANTHLRWDPPGTAPAQRVGRRQLLQLVDEIVRRAEAEAGPRELVACGDFNMQPDDEALGLLSAAGLRSAWDDRPLPTCYANGRAQCVDHVYISASLHAEVLPMTALDEGTPLPTLAEPSDHLPLRVRLVLR